MKKYVKSKVDSSYYKSGRFSEIDNMYLPKFGGGETMASQIVTAVNNLVYWWYNDGGVYTMCDVPGYPENDLTNYANWLYKNVPEIRHILTDIDYCASESDYEYLLQKLCDTVLKFNVLEKYEDRQTTGSIYKCNGPFKYEDRNMALYNG